MEEVHAPKDKQEKANDSQKKQEKLKNLRELSVQDYLAQIKAKEEEMILKLRKDEEGLQKKKERDRQEAEAGVGKKKGSVKDLEAKLKQEQQEKEELKKKL